MIFDTLCIKICRSLIFFLIIAVVFAVWNGTMTAIEIKNIVVQLVCVIIMGLTVMRFLLKEKISIRLDPIYIMAGLYGLILIGGYLGSTRSSLNYNNFIPQIYGLIIFFLISIYFTKEDIPNICFLLVITACIASLYGIIQFFCIDPVNWVNVDKPFNVISFFGHKNYFGLYLLLMLPLGIYLTFSSSSYTIKLVSALSSITMFFALIFSTSRGAIFSAIFVYSFSILSFWLIRRKKIQFKKILFSSGIVISFLIFLFIFIIPKESKDHFYDLANTNSNSPLSIRMSYYKSASEIILKKPYFGVGPGNFVISYPLNKKYKTLTHDPNLTLNHVHNDYLEIWVEYGIFALLLYLGILILFIKNNIAAFLKTGSLSQQLLHLTTASAVVGYLFYSTFTVAGRYMSSVFFLWIVLGIGYMGLRKKMGNVRPMTVKNKLYGESWATFVAGAVIVAIFGMMSKTAFCNYAADVWVHKASMYSLKNDYNRALICLDQAIALNNKVVDAFYQRGYVYYHLNKYDEAIESYKQVQRLAPNYVNIAFNMASCYYRRNDWVNAIKYASISYNHFPLYEPNIVMLAFCYYYIQRQLKALEYCNTILKHNPENHKIKNLTKKLNIIVQNN